MKSKNLYVGIMNQAIKDIHSKNFGQRMCAYKWLNRIEDKDPCSFKQICLHTLNCDSERLKTAIKNKKILKVPYY